MEKAKRNIHYSFKVSSEEDAAIRQKMKAFGIRNRSTYLRAMMLNGYLLKLDLQEMHEAARLMCPGFSMRCVRTATIRE